MTKHWTKHADNGHREIPARQEDVETIEAIVKALYEGITFQPGGEPDWDRLKSLCAPCAKLVSINRETQLGAETFDVEEFVTRFSDLIEKTEFSENGFVERELVRKTVRFGNIAHVFSTYESAYGAADPGSKARGINSIQLMWNGTRWWVVSIMWDTELPCNPLPKEYLP